MVTLTTVGVQKSVLNISSDMAHQSTKAKAFVTTYSSDAPPETVDIRGPVDTLPSEQQPPGVDDDMPQSLEEALLGE